VVADSPRDWGKLPSSQVGPFLAALNDAKGRASLGALMATSFTAGAASCASPALKREIATCSDAYGAALISVEETE